MGAANVRHASCAVRDLSVIWHIVLQREISLRKSNSDCLAVFRVAYVRIEWRCRYSGVSMGSTRGSSFLPVGYEMFRRRSVRRSVLSFRTYARNPPVSEPEMELVISNEYEESPPAIMAGDSSLHFVPFRMTWLSFRKHVKNLFFCSSWEVKMFR